MKGKIALASLFNSFLPNHAIPAIDLYNQFRHLTPRQTSPCFTYYVVKGGVEPPSPDFQSGA